MATGQGTGRGLPIEPPIPPMLAAPAGDALPDRDDLAFEPKWDGFRMLVFRCDDRIVLQGRGGEDLAYAFPELTASLLDTLPPRIVLDGEAVVVTESSLDFAALGSRLRPRSDSATIIRLSREHPATYVAFDLLALGAQSHLSDPYLHRRGLLEAIPLSGPACAVTVMTRDRAIAQEWFDACEGAGLDGLVAKPVDQAYVPGKRTLLKIKHRRTLDAVVAGWRGHAKAPDEVGSLLLGLYDTHGRLHHIGGASGLSAARRREITQAIATRALAADAPHPWRDVDDERVRRPGSIHRWSRGRDQSWHALEPTLVAEVAYDQFEGDRLRHAATWQRWRPDRDARSCTYSQVVAPHPFDVTALLA